MVVNLNCLMENEFDPAQYEYDMDEMPENDEPEENENPMNTLLTAFRL